MTRHHSFVLLLTVALVMATPGRTQPGTVEPTKLELGTRSGLQDDKPRLEVKAGVPVELRFKNTDEMAHNFVLTKPNMRLKVVQEALALGADGPERNYIPESDNVLAATRVILPGKEQILRFVSPTTPGIYPYVCTFPGHGFIMYGALYVDTPMPSLKDDTNIPPQARSAQPAAKVLHAFGDKRPMVYRIFMPDAGPAAIAVALPRQMNYCFDAGQCRLRYAWHGGFVDPMPVWKGNGNGLAAILGHRFWQAPSNAPPPLRVAAIEGDGAVKFRGYRMVGGNPKFKYEIDGVAVEEIIRPTAEGIGLERDFTVEPTSCPVYFVTEPSEGVTFTSSMGRFEDGVLRLKAGQAKSFTITMRHQMEHAKQHGAKKGGAQ